MSITIEITGIDDMLARLDDYQRRVMQAIRGVADYISPLMEGYAKQEAKWTDRTGNARQALHSWVDEVSELIVDIWLSHGVEYGKYLESRFQGRFSIVYPTLEAHFTELMRMLQEIFA